MNASSCDLGIGSDHAGYRYKQLLIDHLRGRGLTVRDFGTDSEESVDYPKYIRPVAEAVASGECRLGIVLGGSGNGEAIVANKVRGIRCAVCWSLDSARLAKEHNNANVISLGQRLIIGRTEGANLILPDAKLSRRHCVIEGWPKTGKYQSG